MNAQQDQQLKPRQRKLDAVFRVLKHLAAALLNGLLCAGGAALGALDEGDSLTSTSFLIFATAAFSLMFIFTFVGYEMFENEGEGTPESKAETRTDMEAQAGDGESGAVPPLWLTVPGEGDEALTNAAGEAAGLLAGALDWLKDGAEEALEALGEVLSELRD